MREPWASASWLGRDPRLPFLHEHTSQSPARWHDAGDGPVNYFSDTPDGAWAEFLRHEEIREPEDLATVRRALWAVDIADEPSATPALPDAALVGGAESYGVCRNEARRLRAGGATRIDAPSAALVRGGARGHRVEGGLRPGPPRDARTSAKRRLFGLGHPHSVGERPGPSPAR